MGNALVLGTSCAVLLNLITRIGVRKRAVVWLEEGQINREAVEQFLAEQGGHWGARRDVINRATFGAVQLLEVLGQPGGGVQLEASFDEFNLDLRVRYRGSPLAFAESQPTRRQILETPEGERLLAGHLLRRSADRVASRALDGQAEVDLHYDPWSETCARAVPTQRQDSHVVRFVTLGLDADFRAATAAMRRCLDIRNQCAHWIWWDDNSGQLALANIEDIAKMATPVNDLAQLNPDHVDAALLHEQEAYFVYTDHYLAWVMFFFME
jgi:hypothetical protein